MDEYESWDEVDDDLFSELDDPDVDEMFEEIIKASAKADEDLCSEIFLLDGTSVILKGMSPIRLGAALATNGVIALEDANGKTVVVFTHGVAAITEGSLDE